MTEMEHGAVGASPRNTRSKGRCFLGTHNNPREEDFQALEAYAKENWRQFVGQMERGADGTPHIQFAFQVHNSVYPTAVATKLKVVLGKQPHIEKALNWEACKNYCRKRETREGETVEIGVEKHRFYDIIRDNGPNKFQERLLERIKAPVDDRKIIWVVDRIGGVGKTSLARHLCIRGNWLYLSGKCSDMKYAIAQYLYTEKGVWRGRELEGVFMDMSRSQESFISYQGVEEIKNAIFFSGKYQAMQVIYDPIYVVCLSNFYPDTTKLSQDRWEIWDMDESSTDPSFESNEL